MHYKQTAIEAACALLQPLAQTTVKVLVSAKWRLPNFAFPGFSTCLQQALADIT